MYFFLRFFPFLSHFFSVEYRKYPSYNFNSDFGEFPDQFTSLYYIALFFVIVLIVTYVISLWKIFKDNNISSWKALIPIYSTYVLLKMLDMSGWWLLLYLIDFGYITSVLINYNLVKKYEKELPFIIGLEVLPFIFYPILAFSNGKSKIYQKDNEIDDDL